MTIETCLDREAGTEGKAMRFYSGCVPRAHQVCAL